MVREEKPISDRVETPEAATMRRIVSHTHRRGGLHGSIAHDGLGWWMPAAMEEMHTASNIPVKQGVGRALSAHGGLTGTWAFARLGP
jgi:hypothetical protein